MTVTNKQRVEDAMELALERLIRSDRHLFTETVNECSLSHRLAIYLEGEIKTWRGRSWNVDCEYNRDGSDIKMGNANLVYPDIIVHKRGVRGRKGNLLAVEIKKCTASETDKMTDREKVGRYKGELEYQFAAFVLLHPSREPFYNIEWDIAPILPASLDASQVRNAPGDSCRCESREAHSRRRRTLG